MELVDVGFERFRLLLRRWYHDNKRTLPWRGVTNPYLIWISEIILQQTRVDQALDYYLRFVERFPSVADLAQADENAVLKYWQGLGYYSRARNLHASSRLVMERFNGTFPVDYQDILSLKGVGDYTAAAICSFAYNKPYAVLDGNVFRFISRYLGVQTPINTTEGKKEFSKLANLLLDKENPAIHNQAMMEMGALQCIPFSPDCSACPMNESCIAFSMGWVSSLPVKLKLGKIRLRYFYYLYIKYKGTTFLKKRLGRDIWKNLYEFPMVEMEYPVDALQFMKSTDFIGVVGNNCTVKSVVGPIKHVLSHQTIYATLFVVDVLSKNDTLSNYEQVDSDKIDAYPVSRLMEIFFDKNLEK